MQHLLHEKKNCASLPFMTTHSAMPETVRDIAPTGSVSIDRVETRLIRLPLNEPFETSFGSIDSRLIFLVSVSSDGVTGWGEVVAAEKPLYSYETSGTAAHVIKDFLAPALIARPLSRLRDLANRFAPIKGHNMAKAGLELAFVDLIARLNDRSLSSLIGGTRSEIPVGVSLGIQPTIEGLLEQIRKYLSLGYQRIKLKIKHGWDLEVLERVRAEFPDILLSVDANSAYTLSEKEHLKQLDRFGLLMIEQPLQHDDLQDHAALQAELRTPICLDESVTGLRQAEMALRMKSCQIVNIKIGRVGGYSQALSIHDLCLVNNVPVWCGGMLESGIGRAHNIALASLPGFTLPGDVSASSRYFARDVIIPEVTVSETGTVEVPQGAGLGFDLDLDFIDDRTETFESIDSQQ
jgi:O-succinylbenzoate synthase